MAKQGSAADQGEGKQLAQLRLPDAETARHWLEQMLLIRRFEERAGDMYARAKIGGFLHLCIGEEATVVGTVAAMLKTDYLLSSYREHGHALARGMEPGVVMAELFGRVDGCSRGRGGSMHLYSAEHRLLGGYGIVGGHLPIAAGVALGSDFQDTDDVTVCMLGDGATNQGTFGETMNLAALWSLPVVFVVVNNQFGMGTALERHSAVTSLQIKGEGFGVSGSRCDGMDAVDVQETVSAAVERARSERKPALVEALTYRFRGHSIADPEEYRTEEQVLEWKKRDPVENFGQAAVAGGVLSADELERLTAAAAELVETAVEFADASPFPKADSLYDDVYVLGDQVHGWYSVDTHGDQVGVRRGEQIKRDEADS